MEIKKFKEKLVLWSMAKPHDKNFDTSNLSREQLEVAVKHFDDYETHYRKQAYKLIDKNFDLKALSVLLSIVIVVLIFILMAFIFKYCF